MRRSRSPATAGRPHCPDVLRPTFLKIENRVLFRKKTSFSPNLSPPSLQPRATGGIATPMASVNLPRRHQRALAAKNACEHELRIIEHTERIQAYLAANDDSRGKSRGGWEKTERSEVSKTEAKVEITLVEFRELMIGLLKKHDLWFDDAGTR
jgi:hypothetical protein